MDEVSWLENLPCGVGIYEVDAGGAIKLLWWSGSSGSDAEGHVLTLDTTDPNAATALKANFPNKIGGPGRHAHR
jgi:hypothetical protein